MKKHGGIFYKTDLGYWVDMDHPYMTMSNEYIESVWHILGTIHEKDCYIKGIVSLPIALAVRLH